MATTRFKTTVDAIKGGLNDFPTDKALQNIEGWEEYLGKHDDAGVKPVLQDLAKLKKLLGGKEVDGEAVKKLLAKMGKDTVKVAGDAKNAEAKHIRELGEALSDAAKKEDDGEDETEPVAAVAADNADDEELEDDEDEDVAEEDDEDLEDDEDEELEDDEDEELEDDEDEELEDDDVEDDDEPPAKAPKKAAKSAAKKAPAKSAGKK